jgi:hypothetical protein
MERYKHLWMTEIIGEYSEGDGLSQEEVRLTWYNSLG